MRKTNAIDAFRIMEENPSCHLYEADVNGQTFHKVKEIRENGDSYYLLPFLEEIVSLEKLVYEANSDECYMIL